VGSLVAFVAYWLGDGALANLALDRVADADPEYTMAALVSLILQSGMPPEKLEPPMTPEQVAAEYGLEVLS
jgi:hypothetical protein